MKKAYIFKYEQSAKRIEFAQELLTKQLKKIGYEVELIALPSSFEQYTRVQGEKFYIGEKSKDSFMKSLLESELLLIHSGEIKPEGFYIQTCPGRLTAVCGADDTGALYGAVELCERIESEGEIPRELAFGDAPAFKLRGPAIGLQLTKLEPPRLTYEYPITPSRFPWFYDKQHWQDVMDMMLRERCNVLYLWSGHPFSSLVKVPDYPYALEVTQEEFEKNKEMFGWLTQECDRRGIWVVLKFYNIHIPLPFAQKHNLELLQSSINPIVEDYTFKSIVEFIKSFPNIGLMVCLGEALRGTQNKTDWFINTIIPAVKEGIKQAGIEKEPPIILRGHDCDPYGAMQKAMKIYSNLYTMWKYNGEGLTTYLPRGEWTKKHQDLSGIGSTHIINVHVLANLEPFRFSAPGFIQKCVKASESLYGANGLHLYPLFFWDWPNSPDKASPRIKQLDRDWVWYKAWMRYAYNPDRNERDEQLYWKKEYAEHFGCSDNTASCILDALENAGQIAPKLLARVGITEGNRQTMTLGMTMSQITNATRHRPNKELYKSVARVGEQPDDYIVNMLSGKPHIGETPYDMIDDILFYAKRAKEKIALAKADKALSGNDEFERICTDIDAINLMVQSYCEKINAAMLILEYKHTMDSKCLGDITLLEKAQTHMYASLCSYRELAALTDETYLYANSMQTPQRKIPFPNGEHYGHWTQCLPEYEKKFANYECHVKQLRQGILPGSNVNESEILPLTGCEFKLLSDDCETYTLNKGEEIFSDCDWKVQNIAPEITGLLGVKFGLGKAIEGGVKIKLELMRDCKVLIGYLNGNGVEWLQLPELETNTHADDRGGLTIVYENAMKVQGCPPINIHAYNYEKGVHELYFGTGGFMIAGVVPSDAKITPRNAGMENEGYDTLDWLYE